MKMEMQLLDWMILLGCLTAAVGGYRLGFVARVASWVGIVGGITAAVLMLPTLLRNADGISEASRLGIVVLITLSGTLIGQMLGLLLGAHISANFVQGRWRYVDQGVGLVAGVFGVLAAMWIILPTAADVPGWSAQQVRSSEIAQEIDKHAPQPPDAIKTLRRLVGSQSFQPVFEGLAPAQDTGPPPTSLTIPADVLDLVKQSTVKVEGTACKRTQNGSGFAIGPNTFVTNAHVVAGEKNTSVIAPDNKRHDATVVAFDADRDIAILRTPTHTVNGLPVASASEGDTGAVFGHPGGQDDLEISPAIIRSKVTAVGRDLYDNRQTRRQVLVLAANLRQGDSGAALVNPRGEVIGIAFAIAPDNPNTAYALDTSELAPVLDQARNQSVSTGPCLND